MSTSASSPSLLADGGGVFGRKCNLQHCSSVSKSREHNHTEHMQTIKDGAITMLKHNKCQDSTIKSILDLTSISFTIPQSFYHLYERLTA